MIHLFTRVMDKRPLYKRDILNVCCFASGGTVQFSYRKTLVAKSLRGGGEDTLLGKEALIVFCEVARGSNNVSRYHPVRKAKIKAAQWDDDSVTMQLELGDFFDYGKYGSDEAIERQLKDFAEHIKTSEEQPTPPNGKERIYVNDEPQWPRLVFTTKWVSLVPHMRTLEGINDAIYFCLQERNTKHAGPTLHLHKKHRSDGSGTTYCFKSGTSKDVELHAFWASNLDIQKHLPIVEITDNVAKVLGPAVEQSSAELRIRYTLQFKRTLQNETSMLTIKVPSSQPNQIISPEYQAMVEVNVSRLMLYSTIALLTFGSVFISVGPDYAKGVLGYFLGVDANNFWIERPLLIPNICKSLGIALFAVGSFLGFNKLPFKA
jgi:hypothetical protein